MAQQIARTLLESLTAAVMEVHQLVADDRGRLASAIDGMARISEDMADIRTQLTWLNQQSESQSHAGMELSSKLSVIEDRLRSQEQAHQRIRGQLAVLSTNQEETAQRLTAQGETLSAFKEEVIAQIQRDLQDVRRQQELLEKRTVANSAEVISEIENHLQKFEGLLQVQAEAAADVRAICRDLQERQQGLEKRLDGHANVIQTLHGAAKDRERGLQELQSTLRGLMGPVALPTSLPENL